MEKHLRVPPPKQEGARPKAFPVAMDWDIQRFKRRVEAGPGAGDRTRLEAGTGSNPWSVSGLPPTPDYNSHCTHR